MGPMNGLNAFRGKTRATASAPMMAQSEANMIRDHLKLSVEGIHGAGEIALPAA
jgi:hypothetical protein